MEHRYCPRLETAHPVGLWHGGEWRGICLTRNISLEGLFIQTSPLGRQEILALRRNPLVRVCMKHLGARRCVSAFVVHRSAQGIGLMLAPPDPAYSEWARNLLNRERLLQTPSLACQRDDRHHPPQISGNIW